MKESRLFKGRPGKESSAFYFFFVKGLLQNRQELLYVTSKDFVDKNCGVLSKSFKERPEQETLVRLLKNRDF